MTFFLLWTPVLTSATATLAQAIRKQYSSHAYDFVKLRFRLMGLHEALQF